MPGDEMDPLQAIVFPQGYGSPALMNTGALLFDRVLVDGTPLPRGRREMEEFIAHPDSSPGSGSGVLPPDAAFAPYLRELARRQEATWALIDRGVIGLASPQTPKVPRRRAAAGLKRAVHVRGELGKRLWGVLLASQEELTRSNQWPGALPSHPLLHGLGLARLAAKAATEDAVLLTDDLRHWEALGALLQACPWLSAEAPRAHTDQKTLRLTFQLLELDKPPLRFPGSDEVLEFRSKRSAELERFRIHMRSLATVIEGEAWSAHTERRVQDVIHREIAPALMSLIDAYERGWTTLAKDGLAGSAIMLALSQLAAGVLVGTPLENAYAVTAVSGALGAATGIAKAVAEKRRTVHHNALAMLLRVRR